MITLTRLSGATFVLNVDLIERMDSTPDTVITLVDGTKYVVADSLEQIRVAVISYRAQIIAAASAYDHHPAPAPEARQASHLTAVPGVRADVSTTGLSGARGTETS